MKKIRLNTSKLKLTKEKIAKLTNNEMKIVGGGDASVYEGETSQGICLTSIGCATPVQTAPCGTTPPPPTPPFTNECVSKAGVCTLFIADPGQQCGFGVSDVCYNNTSGRCD